MENNKHISIFTKFIIYFSFIVIIYASISLLHDFSNNDKYNEENRLVKIGNEKNYYLDYMKKYNIEVIYGDAYKNLAKMHGGVIENNEDNVLIFLRTLKETLDKYPINFFNNKKVTVILLNKFNNKNIALATRNKLNEYRIYISLNDKLERSLHHEIFHIFEYVYNVKDEFEEFSKLNHPSFNYLSSFINLENERYNDFFDGLYVYNYEKNYDNIYFVTKYSKYSEKEDRAEIFAEIMTANNNKYPLYLDKHINTPLKFKCYSVIDVLNEKVDNNGLCYWNRFNYGGDR